jgi:hypothetical protein
MVDDAVLGVAAEPGVNVVVSSEPEVPTEGRLAGRLAFVGCGCLGRPKHGPRESAGPEDAASAEEAPARQVCGGELGVRDRLVQGWRQISLEGLVGMGMGVLVRVVVVRRRHLIVSSRRNASGNAASIRSATVKLVWLERLTFRERRAAGRFAACP